MSAQDITSALANIYTIVHEIHFYHHIPLIGQVPGQEKMTIYFNL